MDFITDNNIRNCVFFELNDNNYLIDTNNVLEIIDLPKLEYPQKLPKHIVGLLQYKFLIINIIDLRSILGVEIKPYKTTNRIIILNQDFLTFGIIADKVNCVSCIKKDYIHETPTNAEDIIRKIYTPRNSSDGLVIDVKTVKKILERDKEIYDTNINMEALMPKDEQSLEILNKRYDLLRDKTNKVTEKENLHTNRYMTFKINNSTYCIKNNYIKEFQQIGKGQLTKVPCTPDFIRGLYNLKGNCVCTIDLESYFTQEKTIVNDKSIISFIEYNNVQIGILANKIGENLYIEEDTLKSQDNKCLMDYVKDGEIYYVVNIEKIFDEKKFNVG